MRDWSGAKAIFWTIAIVFGLIVIAGIEIDEEISSANSSPTAQISQEAESIGTYYEEQPAIGTQRALSRGELRYCLAEAIRLEASDNAVDSYSEQDVDLYNQLVDDYNLRCKDAKYWENDLAPAQRDVEAKRSELETAGWARINPSGAALEMPPTSEDELNRSGVAAEGGRTALPAADSDPRREDDLTGRLRSQPTGPRAGLSPPEPAEHTKPLEAKSAPTPKANGYPANSERSAYGTGWKCKYGFRQAGSTCDPVVLPEHAELNAIGNNWKCKYGYRHSGDGCAAVAIPVNAELNAVGSGWKCQYGYRQSGSECVNVSVPTNAELNVLGNGWKCSYAHRQLRDECVIVNVPVNAELNVLGNGWKCSHGFRQSGEACVRVSVPAHAELNVLGNGWKCKYSYRQQNDACTAVEVPANAELNYLGNGWKCKYGYRQQNDGCKAVEVPANAELNYLGNGWKCKPGFRPVHGECRRQS